jgi:hypothetical protein
MVRGWNGVRRRNREKTLKRQRAAAFQMRASAQVRLARIEATQVVAGQAVTKNLRGDLLA